MPNGMLNEDQMNQLAAMMDEADAANPAPMEEEPPMEENAEPDEVDTVNDNTAEMSEGDAAAEDTEPVPDPNAGETQAPAGPALPEGFQDIGQLIAAYNELRAQADQRGDEMSALRDMTGQLVAIAEALGYGQDMGSIDLNVDESLAESDPKAYATQQIRREVADQLKPMLEAQQKNLRGRMIDQSWKQFAGEHSDAADLMEDIRAVLDEDKSLYDNEHGMEVAYHLARSRKYMPEGKLMEDDGFVERAAENPKIREKVIEKYLKEISKNGENAPASVGSGGRAVPAGKKSISMEDAKKGLLKMLGI